MLTYALDNLVAALAACQRIATAHVSFQENNEFSTYMPAVLPEQLWLVALLLRCTFINICADTIRSFYPNCCSWSTSLQQSNDAPALIQLLRNF